MLGIISFSFSKFSSKRFIPYYKFIDKTFSIVGSYNQGDESYIIIKDKNGKVIQKSENLKLLIDRTSLGKIELIK